MTEDEIAARADRLVERTRREQGLPRTVEDPAVLERVAAILRLSRVVRTDQGDETA